MVPYDSLRIRMMMFLLSLAVAADGAVTPPTGTHLGLGVGMGVETPGNVILVSAGEGYTSSMVSQSLFMDTSARIRMGDHGFTLEPMINCAVSHNSYADNGNTETSKGDLLNCETAMVFRPRISVHNSMELYGLGGVGYTRYLVAFEQKDSDPQKEVMDQGRMYGGISLQKWLSEDSTVSVDLYAPLIVYAVYSSPPDSDVPELEHAWAVAFAPSAKLMVHLYW